MAHIRIELDGETTLNQVIDLVDKVTETCKARGFLIIPELVTDD